MFGNDNSKCARTLYCPKCKVNTFGIPAGERRTCPICGDVLGKSKKTRREETQLTKKEPDHV